ncbi:MAG: chromosome partitioning protein [Treponema sp.]|nr:chromosome partitioning protein [Treponema sp.]
MTHDTPEPGLPGQGSPNRDSQSQDPANLSGMSAAAAKEYIFGFIATLKLTEKERLALEDEAARWKGRVDLARSRGMADLLSGAEKEAERLYARLSALREEESALKGHIDAMRRQLPGLAARERSVDPDVLEQELLMALGRTEETAGTEKAFRELEKSAAADTALQALKAKMKEGAS